MARNVEGRMELRRLGAYEWELPRLGGMRVPGIVYASSELLERAEQEQALRQVANVAHLPGIVRASMAMPDIHLGYGFPIGGVAATDVEDGGVVSPGGVGFDICCGVRLLASGFLLEDFTRRRRRVMDELDHRIPRGTGRGGIAPSALIDDVLERGAVAALDAGYGYKEDLEWCEEGGATPLARPGTVSSRARDRGSHQLGSLGAGNHFLEVQVVDRVEDPAVAATLGLGEGLVCVMIHWEPWPRSPDLRGPREIDGRGDAPLRNRGTRPTARLRARPHTRR